MGLLNWIFEPKSSLEWDLGRCPVTNDKHDLFRDGVLFEEDMMSEPPRKVEAGFYYKCRACKNRFAHTHRRSAQSFGM